MTEHGDKFLRRYKDHKEKQKRQLSRIIWNSTIVVITKIP